MAVFVFSLKIWKYGSLSLFHSFCYCVFMYVTDLKLKVINSTYFSEGFYYVEITVQYL